MFTKAEEKTLLDLFKQYAPSRNNIKVINFITGFLTKNEIPFTKDEHGNIFSLHNTDMPILSAHMDSVGVSDCGFLNDFVNIFDYRGDRIMKGMGNIGGDDKCGIFLILMKIKEDKSLNFIFSIDEEIGCVGIKQVVPKNDISKFPYALVLDRRGAGDIICFNNNYGTKEFENALADIGKEFRYLPATGACSDANTIREYISCANLSVAYHNPHTKNEFVSIIQLYNTKLYVDSIIEKLKGKKFLKPIVTVTRYTYDDEYYRGTGNGKKGGKSYTYGPDTFWCSVCRSYQPKTLKRTKNKESKTDWDGICQTCLDSINGVK